jgi:hypothetical protein
MYSLGQEADPAQDRQPQRRRQGQLRHLGPAVRDRDHLLLGQRPEQLGHEQRVSRRAGHPGEQPPGRGAADGVGDQVRHRPPVQLAQGQAPASGRLQRDGQPLQAGHGRGRAEAPDDRHGQAVQPGGQRAQGHQARRVGPVQVVRADNQRPVQREFLGQVGERVHGAELQARVAGHGDRSPVPAIPAVPAGQ